MNIKYIFQACLCILFLWASTGSAQKSNHTQMQELSDKEISKKEAIELYREAQVQYNLGKFRDAADKYSKAYEVTRLPGFLFNLGQCYRELKNYDRAIFFFQGYLREKPETDNRKLVEDLIHESETKLDEQQNKALKKAENHHKELSASFYDDKKTAQKGSVDQDDSSDPIYKSWWFWTIVSSAVIATTSGVILAVSSKDDRVLPSGSLGTLDFRGL